MKSLSLCLVLSMSFSFVFGQKILLVDDSKDNFQNTAALSDALTSINKTHDLFDAVSEQETPNLIGLLEYDIVIWHTSSDGANLHFWEAMDQENEVLKSYLDEGKILWVIGNDMLFDRYSVGTNFDEGSFEYDYMGISLYDAQSYQDDGSIGMPSAAPSADNPISDLSELTWQFETLWNADAVSLAGEAVAVYDMSSSANFPDYTFDGLHTAVLNQINDYTVLTYFFDLSLAETSEIIASNMEAVLAYFDGLLVNTESVDFDSEKMKISPNPVFESIQISSERNSDIHASIYSSEGKLIKNQKINKAGLIDVSDLKSGMYYIQFSSAKQLETQPFIKL